jgi:hypothetical protein
MLITMTVGGWCALPVVSFVSQALTNLNLLHLMGSAGVCVCVLLQAVSEELRAHQESNQEARQAWYPLESNTHSTELLSQWAQNDAARKQPSPAMPIWRHQARRMDGMPTRTSPVAHCISLC